MRTTASTSLPTKSRTQPISQKRATNQTHIVTVTQSYLVPEQFTFCLADILKLKTLAQRLRVLKGTRLVSDVCLRRLATNGMRNMTLYKLALELFSDLPVEGRLVSKDQRDYFNGNVEKDDIEVFSDLPKLDTTNPDEALKLASISDETFEILEAEYKAEEDGKDGKEEEEEVDYDKEAEDSWNVEMDHVLVFDGDGTVKICRDDLIAPTDASRLHGFIQEFIDRCDQDCKYDPPEYHPTMDKEVKVSSKVESD